MRIAIIGGGISGLSAAYTLEKERAKGADVEYTLFESSNRLGGACYSEIVDGCVIEAGPDSFVSEKPWAAALCRELGIGDQLIGSNDNDRKTWIVNKGKLISLPDGLMFLVPTKILPTAFSPLFSWSTKLRMARELMHPPRPMNGDETVAAFVERHFGREMVDRLADPMLSGIYGGDTDQLSVRATLARFVEMEAKYGSLSRAMLVANKKMKAAMAGKPKPPLFTSLRNGMQQMVDAVLAKLPSECLTLNTAVESIEKRDGKYYLTLSSAQGFVSGQRFSAAETAPMENGALAPANAEIFDAIILATPANIAGRLLANIDNHLSEDLAAIPYSSSATVILAYDMADLKSLPGGHGFLVPRTEGRRMRACTFVHNKFPHRAPPDKGVLRCFMGGANDAAILQSSDEEITAIVQRELREIVHLEAQPKLVRVYRWRGAMAQYPLSHLDRVDRIEKAIAAIPGLAVAGNAFRGIGVPDCVRTGTVAAQSVLDHRK
ncbi:protoporphyrinogen oxidase [Candidatus Koribacter versatilis Ellin345]|uniref:Coproporphyrinogen III oxidase n=1 Tax=Koribacter versatilis (strain Ellin345) TaxID=204669 RepID=Q1ITV0_KORVE|nr:protoporphyrinogen oxidase [Candidatus Koribacter versatilis]ABF39700.1 protoporphyrinogen oxidase [Candidatus Koribacter versatilis Ellin345]